MNKLIFSAFAVGDANDTGVNISKKNNYKEIYYKNICVSLISSKKNNSDCDVALVTNSEVPSKYKRLLDKNNVLIKYYDFDLFIFPKTFKWFLAFYKLCALSHVLHEEYDYFLMIDCDTYTQCSCAPIWKECEQNILLSDINHGLNTLDYIRLLDDYQNFSKEIKYITHYGGEFIAGNKKLLDIFMLSLKRTYDNLLNSGISFSSGDEFVISISAADNKEIIKNASPYVYRFWTGTFRLVSTVYQKNKVCILHLPDEKETGMIKLYKKISKNRNVSSKTIYRYCHLKKASFKVGLKIIFKKIVRKHESACN